MPKKKSLPKNQNEPDTKNQLELKYIFSQTLKVKKKYNMNFPHQIESFDTNNMFGSFFILAPLLSISSFHNKSKLIGL
jgi:hypothetical protein